MRVISFLLLLAIVCLGCEADLRDRAPLPDPDPVTMPEAPPVVVSGAPMTEMPPTCACPMCGEEPLLASGSACSLTLGQLKASAVEIRMQEGGTFSVWQGDDADSLSLQRKAGETWALARFLDSVKARSYAVGSAKLVKGDFDVVSCVDTCVAHPEGAVLIGTLPLASEFEGRTFTIKVLDDSTMTPPGEVDVFPSFDPSTGEWDTIDGRNHFLLFGELAAAQIRSTGTAWIVVASHRF